MMNPIMSHSLNTSSLKTISVSDFFSQINWHGQPALGAEGEEATLPPYETVGQFFNTFPWQGSATAPPPSDWELFNDDEITNPIEEEGSLTLEDLSALF